MNFTKIMLYITSPTYLYADYKKKKLNEQQKASFIIKKNKEYFNFSLLTFVLFLLIDSMRILFLIGDQYINYLYPIMFILFFYYFSRVNEIFFSFLLDVLDKLNNDHIVSFLTFKERIELAAFSYFELIINYALMYWIISFSIGLFNMNDLFLVNFLYYSCVTIVTLGYGDIHATHFIPQLLSVYEVFNGMILIIVCFTIYVSLNYNKELSNMLEEYKLNYHPDEEQIKRNYHKFIMANKKNFYVALVSLIIIFILSFFIITTFFDTNLIISFFLYLLFTMLLIILFINKTR